MVLSLWICLNRYYRFEENEKRGEKGVQTLFFAHVNGFPRLASTNRSKGGVALDLVGVGECTSGEWQTLVSHSWSRGSGATTRSFSVLGMRGGASEQPVINSCYPFRVTYVKHS
jgi:hypothetical protein